MSDEEADRKMHLILDGHAKNNVLLQDAESLKKWLVKIAKFIGMTVYGEPQVVDYPWPGSNYTALSAVCWLGESSILVHTYPEIQGVFIDVFSCKDFNYISLEGTICRDFGIAAPKVIPIERGVKDGEIIRTRLVGG